MAKMKRCTDASHLHSGLVSLHPVEHLAVAAGLNKPLTDAAEAQRIADEVCKATGFTPVTVRLSNKKNNYGTYYRQSLTVAIDARIGNYKTLAHELAHHATRMEWERNGKRGKKPQMHGKQFQQWFALMIRRVAEATDMKPADAPVEWQIVKCGKCGKAMGKGEYVYGKDRACVQCYYAPELPVQPRVRFGYCSAGCGRTVFGKAKPCGVCE